MVFQYAAALIGLAGYNGHRTSNENNERDQSLQGDAAATWEGDRQHIQNEYQTLSSDYLAPAPPAITTPEAFDTWSHQEIYEALNGGGSNKNGAVQQADINAGADGWRRLQQQAENAITAFREGIEEDIDKLWSGKSANAAMTASQSYADEFQTLSVSFQQVANGIDLIQGYLDQAKLSVPPPEELDTIDEILGHIPGNGVLKLGKHRANEAESRAQEVMKTYQVGATEVDSQTPILPEPKSPVSNPGSNPTDPGSNPTGNGNNPPGSGNTSDNPYSRGSDDPSGTEDPNAPGNDDQTDDPSSGDDPSSDDPTSDDPWSDPTGTDPSSTNPASTNPASNLPSGLTDPSSRPSLGTPGAGSPGSGSPGSGSPSSTPSPGASIPGGAASTASPSGSGTGNSRAGSGAGRMGMPGMGGMGAGRGGGGKDDESEHNIPDYLVQDRTTELLGEQPRVLPPGGVIGG